MYDWKKVLLSNKNKGTVTHGYAQFRKDKNGEFEPIDLDENGFIKVYDLPNGNQVSLGLQIKTGWTEVEDPVSAKYKQDNRTRAIDYYVNNFGYGKLADILAGAPGFWMVPEMAEGADNIRNGNYIKGSVLMASPLIFMSGPLGTLARTGIGGYNFLSEDGLPKTLNYFNNGETWKGIRSATGDALNLLMASEGLNYAGKGLNYLARMDMPRYGFRPSTQYQFAPEYSGMNAVPIEKTPEVTISGTPIRVTSVENSNKLAVTAKEVKRILQLKLGRELTAEETDEILNTAANITGTTINGEKAAQGTVADIQTIINSFNRNHSPQSLKTRNLANGEKPYTLEELVNEEGYLRDNTGLKESTPGSHGDNNFFRNNDDSRTRAIKYFRTKYGTDRGDIRGILEDNPYSESGVLVTTGNNNYSIDSFKIALNKLKKSLRAGRRFSWLKRLDDYVKANNYGQVNRYTEKFDPEFLEYLLKIILSKGDIPDNLRVLSSNGKLFFLAPDGKIVGRLIPRDALSIVNEYNTQIENLNKRYDLNINPAKVSEEGNILWPNIFGLLYKSGGKLRNISYDKLRNYRKKCKKS